MKLSPVATCSLFGGFASLYGVGIALVSMVTGLFKQDLSSLISDQHVSALVAVFQHMANGQSVRMLVVSMVSLVLFIAILILDRKQTVLRA